MVSTAGYQNVQLTMDMRHANASNKYVEVLYTGDGGTNWQSWATFIASSGNTGCNGRFVDFTGALDVDNNALFGVNVISIPWTGDGNCYASHVSQPTIRGWNSI